MRSRGRDELLSEQMEMTRSSFPPSKLIKYLPEKFIEISMLHVLKDHDERVTIHTDAIELDDVIMLKIGQQLRFTLEILSGGQSGILKSLEREKDNKRTFGWTLTG